MFDYTHVDRSVHFPKTIEEKRAHTDESIRLAKEYEEKITEKIVDVYRTPRGNLIEGVVVQFAFDPSCFSDKIYVAFQLNGEKITIEIDSDRNRLDALSSKELANYLCEQLSQKIAEKLLPHLAIESTKRHKDW